MLCLPLEGGIYKVNWVVSHQKSFINQVQLIKVLEAQTTNFISFAKNSPLNITQFSFYFFPNKPKHCRMQHRLCAELNAWNNSFSIAKLTLNFWTFWHRIIVIVRVPLVFYGKLICLGPLSLQCPSFLRQNRHFTARVKARNTLTTFYT